MSDKIINYRVGSYYTIPATTVALIIAHFVEAPSIALLSIGISGYGIGILLFILGKKSVST